MSSLSNAESRQWNALRSNTAFERTCRRNDFDVIGNPCRRTAAQLVRRVPALSIELPPRARAFWASFESTAGSDASARFYESFHFGDSESLANELAALVLAGTKCATASLLWSYEADDKPMPKPGYLSIVEKWSGEPICIIETAAVAVLPFEQVGPEFAATEGEGDASLEHWRTGHWAYFGRECARIGKKPSASMLVVCESFKVVYRGFASEAY